MPTDHREPVEIAVERFVKETDKALLVEIEGEEVWLPRSQIEDIDRMDDGTGVLTVSAWIAHEKGLVER